MYKIIGADGKEYGPISLEQLRRWMAEGRANLQTRVLPDGAAQWVTIAELPEFVGAPPPPPAPGVFGASVMPAAASMDVVNGPAIGLIVVAVLGFLIQAGSLIWRLTFGVRYYAHQPHNPLSGLSTPGVSIVLAVIGMVVSGFILFGALKMKKLESYSLAMATSIVAMIPCISPCCFIGLPIGIWALVVLSKPDVKSAFH